MFRTNPTRCLQARLAKRRHPASDRQLLVFAALATCLDLHTIVNRSKANQLSAAERTLVFLCLTKLQLLSSHAGICQLSNGWYLLVRDAGLDDCLVSSSSLVDCCNFLSWNPERGCLPGRAAAFNALLARIVPVPKRVSLLAQDKALGQRSAIAARCSGSTVTPACGAGWIPGAWLSTYGQYRLVDVEGSYGVAVASSQLPSVVGRSNWMPSVVKP